MANDLQPAIAELEKRIFDMERKTNELRSAVNVLCEAAGLPPRYPDPNSGGGNSSGSGSSNLSQIRGDTFYGKPLATAVREYLEMRKAQGMGPATPRDIFDAMKSGGYKFDTKNEGIALVSLRAALRKNNKTFHKLPSSGSYGLLSWYPNVKPSKVAPADDDESEEVGSDKTETATPKGAAA